MKYQANHSDNSLSSKLGLAALKLLAIVFVRLSIMNPYSQKLWLTCKIKANFYFMLYFPAHFVGQILFLYQKSL